MVFGKSFFEVSIFCTAFWCLQKDFFQKIVVFSFWPLDHNLCIFGTCRNYFLCSLDPGESTGNNYSITRVTKKILSQEKHIFSVLPESNVDEAKIWFRLQNIETSEIFNFDSVSHLGIFLASKYFRWLPDPTKTQWTKSLKSGDVFTYPQNIQEMPRSLRNEQAKISSKCPYVASLIRIRAVW